MEIKWAVYFDDSHIKNKAINKIKQFESKSSIFVINNTGRKETRRQFNSYNLVDVYDSIAYQNVLDRMSVCGSVSRRTQISDSENILCFVDADCDMTEEDVSFIVDLYDNNNISFTVGQVFSHRRSIWYSGPSMSIVLGMENGVHVEGMCTDFFRLHPVNREFINLVPHVGTER